MQSDVMVLRSRRSVCPVQSIAFGRDKGVVHFGTHTWYTTVNVI